MAIRFLQGQAITGTLSVSSTTTLAAATVSAPSTSDDSIRIPSTAWVKDQNYITSGSLPTVNNNTITFTAGTGLTGGGAITLNQSFNETITFNNSITNNNQLTNGAGYTTNTGTTTASNTQTFTNKSGNISQWTNNSGYITAGSLPTVNNATITLSAGTGLSGGGVITLNQASNETVTFNNTITNNNQLTNGAGYTTNTGTTTAGNTQTFTNKSGNISQWTNDAGYTTSVGDITGVTAGSGMSGGGTSGTVTLTNADKGSSQNIFKNVASDSGTAVADNNNDTLTIVGAGSVTTAVSGDTLTITGTDDNENYYVSGASYSSGTLTLTRNGLSTLTATGFPTNNNQLSNGAGYITSASLPTVNNGTLTMTTSTGLDGGTQTFTANQSNNTTFAVSLDLSELTDMTAAMNTNDEFIVLDSSAERRKRAGEIGLSIFSNDSGFTTNTGTTTASNSQTFTNKSGNISQWTNNSGYITSGSLPTVNNATIIFSAGTGLSGGGTITLNQSSNETVTFNNTITNNNQLTNGSGYTTNTGTTTAGNTQTFTNKSGNISQWTNDAGYTTSVGDITGVTAGSGISGGGTSGTVTITNSDKGSSQNIFKNFAVSGQSTVVADSNNDTITLVASGGMTITTNATTDTITFNPNDDNDNYYVTSGSYSNGTLTLNRQGLGAVSVTGFPTNNNQLSNGAGYTTNTGTTTASNSQTFTNKGGNISQWTNDSGYVTSSGGSMSSWILKEGNGTESTSVTNGETVTFAQGTGIETELTSTSSGGTLTISNTITNNNQLTNGAGYTTNTGTTTASNSQTFTNKGGNISQWTNNSGYTTNVGDITGVTAGTGMSGGGTSGTVTLNCSITNNNQLTNGAGYTTNTGTTTASNSQTFTNKGGNISQWTNNSGYITAGSLPTVNDATITLSAGTGLSGGGTITLNQSSNETVTFNNSITNNNQLTNGAGYTTNTGTTTASNSQTFTNKSGSNSQWTNDAGYVTASQAAYKWELNGDGGNDYNVTNLTVVDFVGGTNISTETSTTAGGLALTINNGITNNNQLTNGAGYTTNVGDITGVSAGTGMSGGGTSGTVTLNCDITNNNQLTNGAGYTTNVGDITGVTAGTGMSGGGTSGAVTLNCDIAAANNATITFAGGDGMKDGGTFTTNQSFNETITLNMDYAGTDNFILASASAVGTSIQSTDKIIYSDVGNNDIQYGNVSDLPFTNNSGDITNVTAGTGMSGGGTSGSVTLNCDITNNNQLTNGAGYTTNTGTTTPSNTQTFTNKSGNISQWTNNSGYTTNSGTVTGSGTANRIAFWNSSSAIGSDADLQWNNSQNKLIIDAYSMQASTTFIQNSDDEDISTVINGFGGNGKLTIGENAVFTTAAGFSVPSGYGISVGTSATASNTIRSTGNIIAYYSDERLKDFEGNIPNALDKVCQLGGYYYKQNKVATELGYENYERQVGVNAQEVYKVMPEVVEIAPISYNEEANGVEYLTVDYAKLVPLLIESIKELKAEVDALKAK